MNNADESRHKDNNMAVMLKLFERGEVNIQENRMINIRPY